MAWLKFLHISALLIWCAGLVYLPGLLLAHRTMTDREDFIRIRNASRFSYSAIASPAAFVAIGAGTALLLLAPGVLQGWMFLKLALVGLLVMAHVQYGFVLTALSEPGAKPPRLRLMAVWILVFGVMTGILWLVLEKPFLGSSRLPGWLLEPGGLQSLLTSTPI
ncbi:MAG: CopD family protein [Alphaproteobacteria bacterium]|nr:CopD family protein [Alphaproteobacteria bacterium]